MRLIIIAFFVLININLSTSKDTISTLKDTNPWLGGETFSQSISNTDEKKLFEIYPILEQLFSYEFKLPNISTECRDVGSKLLLPIIYQPTTKGKIAALLASPAGKMLDACGKLPERLLLGNFQLLGAYDECSALGIAKYCLSPVYLIGKIKASYGSCFPKGCSTKDVTALLSMLNNYTKGMLIFSNSSAQTLCEKPIVYSTGVMSTLVLIGVILFLCVLGTLTEMFSLNCSFRKFPYFKENFCSNDQWEVLHDPTSADPLEQGENEDSTSNSTNVAMENNASIRAPSPVIEVRENKLTSFLQCFSLLKNTRAILSTHVPDGAITSINGIRVISLTWVILGHIYYFMTFIRPDNIGNILIVIHRFTFLAIGNAYVSVDSFFVLSGLLVSYLTLKRFARKRMGCSEILLFYIHRLIRLIPPLGMTILIYTNLMPHIITGPKSALFAQTDLLAKPCIKYWWSTLFFFNNFYPTENGEVCIGWTWYLSNDMQFYIIALPILFAMVAIEKRCRDLRKGILFNFLFIMSLCFVSMVITGVITGVYDIPALNTAAGLPNNPRINQTGMIMDRVYDKPYCRVTTYLIGLFLGYILSRKVAVKYFSKMASLIGWIVAIVVGLSVVYGPWHVFKENGTFFNDAENIIYAACNRFAWGCALAWVIYACHNKMGGLVNEFLSWKVWIPLSRLTYGAYLLHFIVLIYFYMTRETPNHYQDNITAFDFVSNTVMTYACAFILAVCVEYPVFNLEKKIFNR